MPPFGGGNSLWNRVLGPELAHEVGQGEHALVRHGGVQGGPTAANRAVALELDESLRSRFLDKLGFKSFVSTDTERDVQTGTVPGLDAVGEVTIRLVDELVEHLGA